MNDAGMSRDHRWRQVGDLGQIKPFFATLHEALDSKMLSLSSFKEVEGVDVPIFVLAKVKANLRQQEQDAQQALEV